METCIFCKIIKGEIPADKVYEDENILAFLDANPVNPGHTLVIPKKHFAKIEETPDEIISKIFIKSKELMKKIKIATDADFVVLSIVGLDVPHFHIHLVPRYHNDGMAYFWPGKEFNEKKSDEIIDKIKKQSSLN